MQVLHAAYRCVEQGAKDVIHDLRSWCREDGGPLALGVVSVMLRVSHFGTLRHMSCYPGGTYTLSAREYLRGIFHVPAVSIKMIYKWLEV